VIEIAKIKHGRIVGFQDIIAEFGPRLHCLKDLAELRKVPFPQFVVPFSLGLAKIMALCTTG
jgi:hypothetical protein